MRQAYPTAHAPDTVFCRAGPPLRDETVAIWDEPDGRTNTNCPLTASYGGVTLIHRRRDVMTRIATSMLLLGGLAGLAVAGAAGAGTVVGDRFQTVVRYSNDSLATDSGTRALYRQLDRAADQACPIATNTPPVNEHDHTYR